MNKSGPMGRFDPDFGDIGKLMFTKFCDISSHNNSINVKNWKSFFDENIPITWLFDFNNHLYIIFIIPELPISSARDLVTLKNITQPASAYCRTILGRDVP